MGSIISYKRGEDSVGRVDPRLWDIVQHAIASLPYDAEIRSGSERSKGDAGNHSRGYAVDVTLIDPATGEKLPDYQEGKTFAVYEQYAQAARVYQSQTYPELNDTFRWGGYFSKNGNPFGYGAADLMHLDITPSAKGAMGLGSWEKGASKALLDAYPGAVSNGGLAGPNGTRLVSQYRQSLAGSGGLVPPAGMASDPPIPATMSAGLRSARPEGPSLGFDPNKPGADPSSLYAGILPRSEEGQVTPRLVGTEDNYQVGRVTPNMDRQYDADNRMSTGGRGALLDPRSFSPATPNPSPSSPAPVAATGSATGSAGTSALASAKARLAAAKQAATVAPGAGLTRTQQDAMRAVPASPSTFPARPGVVAPNTARPAAPPSTFPARPATIAPNIVPGMVSPSPRPYSEVATARANQAPASIPKTAAERVWETTHFGDPYDMPGVGMPKFSDIAVKMAKTPPLPRPRPAPTVPQFIPKTIQVAVDNSPNAIPQGMGLNSGSRDSVAQREAGKAAALKLYTTKTVMVPNPAYVAPRAQPNPAQIEAARLAELRRIAAEQAARQATAARAAAPALRLPSTAGAKLAAPRTEGQTVTGADNAFQPRSVQESVRWQTGY